MNRSTIRANIRREIEDQGSFYTDTDLNNAIQECYSQYGMETRVIEKKVTLDFQDDLVYYNFRTLVPDFLYVIAIYNHNSRSWLTGKNRLWLDGTRKDWETSTGEARWFSIINHELVAITPCQPTAAGEFTLYYIATAPILNDDTTTVQILKESEDIFTTYAFFYLMLQAREFSKGKLALQEYDKRIKSAIQLMQSRGLPTRRYQLQG